MILAKIVVKSIVDFFILISLVDIGEVSTEIIIGVDEIFKHATKQFKKKIEDKTKKDDKDKE